MKNYALLFYILILSLLSIVTVVKGCHFKYDSRFCNCVKNTKEIEVIDIKRKDMEPSNYFRTLKAVTCGYKEIEYYKDAFLQNNIPMDIRWHQRQSFIHIKMKNMFDDAEKCIENAIESDVNDLVSSIACCTGENSNLGKYKTYKNLLNQEIIYEICINNFKRKNIILYC